ncbi:response regulator [Lachnoclostridium phytofermentans]|uniref:Stage 0 sporulation protein A homolog n=1 Tax=Lachnoclostridium phytofermentans (strain ATCC 700394 / DSM 18823 / ISDg) TaxID=357809 RepID=A9KIB1_LACP7|nr:response regulator [Lachnoclostridium phytofermentans]ABX40945.1 response regulator receiver protein [Lachnoclostridium phytofermentans ISDg]
MIDTIFHGDKIGATALIVDDNPVNLIAGGMMLKTYGLSVETAGGGRDALEKVAEKDYDLIFMDLMMPEIDGVETAKRIHKLVGKFGQVIIAISGALIGENEKIATTNEFSDVLEKPIEADKLSQCLKRWLPKEKLCENLIDSFHEIGERTDEVSEFIEIFQQVTTLDCRLGLHYALNQVDNYIRIAEASMKQLIQSKDKLELITEEKERGIMQAECHSLKSILYHLGSRELAEDATALEMKRMSEESLEHNNSIHECQMEQLKRFLMRINLFCSELEQALIAYNNRRNPKNETMGISNCSKEVIAKQQGKVLYHISHYEYFEIINGLRLLLTMVSKENQKKIHQAMEAAEEFDYENTAKYVNQIII